MAVPEAKLEDGGPQSEGWFVVNARDARWFDTHTVGMYCNFEGADRFPELGLNLNALRPGESNGKYHGEGSQENFLVLEGECVLIVEGQERRLRKWDFVHCPPWTEHTFVGAGDEPCLLLAVGARGREGGVRFPVNETALRYGAGVEHEVYSPEDAYPGFHQDRIDPPPSLRRRSAA